MGGGGVPACSPRECRQVGSRMNCGVAALAPAAAVIVEREENWSNCGQCLCVCMPFQCLLFTFLFNN